MFDSVEYPVLLERLFNVEVNGKLWFYAAKNFLKLNALKCEVVVFGQGQTFVNSGSSSVLVLFRDSSPLPTRSSIETCIIIYC